MPIDLDDLIAPLTAASEERRVPWSEALTAVWIAGALLALIRLLSGVAWAAWIARRARPIVDADWLAQLGDAAAALGVRRSVQLLQSDRVGVPAVWGVFRPKLLLPVESDAWTSEQRRVVLLHELAHVRRGDCVVQPLARVALAIHWYQPLAHFASSRLQSEQERACDDIVLAAGLNGPDYAHHLCDIVRAARAVPFPEWATLAIGRRSRLERRVQAVLDATCNRQAPSWRFAAALAALALCGIIPLSAVRPAKEPAAVDLPLSTTTRVAHMGGLTTLPDVAQVRPNLAAPARPDIAPDLTLSPAVAPVRQATAPQAFIADYCAGCHGASRNVAGLSLSATDVDHVGERPAVWEKVVRKLRSGIHPPRGGPRPDHVSAETFVSYLEAVLDSNDQANWNSGTAVRLTGTEIAERLATFLWSARPDAELVALAARGGLSDPGEVSRQVRRMLADARATSFLTGFFGQWLYLRNMDQVKPDPTAFPDFDASLPAAFRRETELFVESQVRDDRPVTELLSANYTFVNERLARHYGIPNVSGDEFRRITLRNDARSGLLGQASILTATSYANRTSPVLRGKFVLEIFLGTPPPPPPPNVPRLKENDPDRPTSMRARLEDAVKAPVCASCHTMMDSIGLAFENFDATGRWRDTDAGVPIDASGTLADQTTFNGPVEFRMALLQRSDAFVSVVTERLLSYAIGRPIEFYDMPAVRAVVREAAVNRHRWSPLIAGLVTSTPFQMKRAAP